MVQSQSRRNSRSFEQPPLARDYIHTYRRGHLSARVEVRASRAATRVASFLSTTIYRYAALNIMDGSDDYFDDDLILDDQTLAALDLEEKKWQEEQQQQAGQRRPLGRDAPLPAAKKQKTTHELTPDGLIPRVGAINVEDYDDLLPDISIINDGSYKLPAEQRASANELAKQMRGANGHINGASTSNRATSARAPPGPPRRHPAPVQAPSPFTRHASGGSSSSASGSGPSQGPAASARSQHRQRPRHTALSQIEAALANFVPPPTNAPPQPTVQSSVRSSRPSPVSAQTRPPASSRPARHSISPSTSVRPQVRKPSLPPAAAPRGVRGSSPSVSIPVDRRQSVAGPSRQRGTSPAIPPQPPPPQPQPLPPQLQPPLSQGVQQRDLRIEVETLKAQLEEVRRVVEEWGRRR